MHSYRLSLLFIAAMIGVVLLHNPAEAFWGFGSGKNMAESGLDLDNGYDRNTVVTVTGRVAVSASQSADPVTVTLVAGSEQMTVVLGPRWYLQHDNLTWQSGDVITIRGARARGSDGRTYLLAQWVTDPSGARLVLRSEAGKPGWSSTGRGLQPGNGTGQQQRGGSGKRGR